MLTGPRRLGLHALQVTTSRFGACALDSHAQHLSPSLAPLPLPCLCHCCRRVLEVTVMPCFDRKLEAARKDFWQEGGAGGASGEESGEESGEGVSEVVSAGSRRGMGTGQALAFIHCPVLFCISVFIKNAVLNFRAPEPSTVRHA